MNIPAQLNTVAYKAVRCCECFSDGSLHNSYVDIAQPRYVGTQYWTSKQKVAFVMVNPGAGTGDWRNQDWRSHLYSYRDNKESLEEVFKAQRVHMPFWGGGKLIPFIEKHGLDVDRLALVNIAWCSTQENKYPKRMLRSCLKRHTLDWLKILSPKIIILSGTASHDFKDEISSNLPNTNVNATYHYAHRPLDSEKANNRAADIKKWLRSIS